jgi:hypothetical protein
MGRQKFDGVIECVRYKPTGEVEWVRAYERRGATYSDHILLKREALVQKLKSGKKFVAGSRTTLLASTFQVTFPVRLIKAGEREILVTGDLQSNQDRLEGVPLI